MSLYDTYLYVCLYVCHKYRQACDIPQDIYEQKNTEPSHIIPYPQTFEPFLYFI